MPKLFTILLICCISQSALANKSPKRGHFDSRIKLVTYNPNDVVTLTTHYGFSTMIEFAKHEVIKTISLGDTLAWNLLDVENKIFIKPVENNADTNMQVITNIRAYNFVLIAKKSTSHHSSSLTFSVKFRYPQDDLILALRQREKVRASSLPKPHEIIQNRRFKAEKVNMEYTLRGSKENSPKRVFDDGKFTYFYFENISEIPAIFVGNTTNENESLVNFHKKGKYIVVQRIAQKFILRNGDKVTCIYNEDYKYNDNQLSNLPIQGTSTADQHIKHLD